jgi:hypothetical protein
MVMVFVRLFVLFVWFLTRDLSVLVIRTFFREMLQSEPPRLAPYCGGCRMLMGALPLTS